MEFRAQEAELRIFADGPEIARTPVEGVSRDLLRKRGRLRPVQWNHGAYDLFGERTLSGKLIQSA